ncbi:hypothetical protein NMQ01_03165 [Janibacter sp. CX7]|uniref:hypothetical protein n=1 Tax=unclassified Janibacter TaxID=2649294 RepID=UPI0020CED49D|nr:hypothetical protein [Janibacter sp. CX7]UTT66729.1 hypothetical protein NMQ01_03165 [Janibacter sp. CX7]
MQPLTIRHSRPMGITFVALGVLIALVSLLTSAWVTVAAGVVLTALGILQLVNPMLRIEPHEVRMCNPLGMTLRRFPLTEPRDLVLDGKNLLHVPTGKRVAALGFGVHQPDVEALRRVVPVVPRG